jgi:RNA polymerase sigma-70 factor (ECF subfamily)
LCAWAFDEYDSRAMPGRDESGACARPVVYCLIPLELAGQLHEVLRRHFVGDPAVEVIVERRGAERRLAEDRRQIRQPASEEAGRRRIRSVTGRRVGDRRAPLIAVVPDRPLPRRARPHLAEISFVERLEPSTQALEDRDSARLVMRIQAGDAEAFSALYMRYFDRVYDYLRIALRDSHTAEDGVQQVFMKAFESIDRYEWRGTAFRAWLFTIARNVALMQLRAGGRTEVTDPIELNHQHGQSSDAVSSAEVLDWISNRELMMFIERLPLPQRQVLVLRYVLDLRISEVAQVMGRSANDISQLHSRALSFLRARLSALGSAPDRHHQRVRARRRVVQAWVLRSRRYALR